MSNLNPGGLTRVLNYIKTWVTGLLNDKANSSHTHTKSQITDFPTIPSKTSQLTNDSGFLTAHQSLSNYSTLANTVKSLSISGKTITVTPGSGSAYTLTTQDTVYTHPTTAGNKHIPSGGSANQYLKYSESGTAVWANLPTIPSKTSQLTNDSGFLTSHQSLANYVTLNTAQTISGNKTFNDRTIFKKGSYMHSFGSGVDVGYIKFATITIAAHYQDCTATLVIMNRSYYKPVYVYIKFNGTDNVDPNINSFATDATANNANDYYLVKSATSTWDLYVYKTAWNTFCVLDFWQSQNNVAGITFTWKDEFVSSLPSDNIKATFSAYNYNDLSNKPTIPTVNNATLTIQKNGSNVATFTSNASSNVTANISVPTKTSQLTNDSGFITGNDSRLSDARTPYFANGTWYSVGDDVAIGDHNVSGGLGVKALNNATTRIDLCYKDDASNYKSITYDGTTLYMNGNCNYANSAGSVAWSNVTSKPTIRTDILHFAAVSSLDANAISEDGIWYVCGGITGAPMQNHGVLVYVKSVGTPFQMYFPDNLFYVYKRYYTSGAWGSWEKMNSRSWDDIQYINGYKVYVG